MRNMQISRLDVYTAFYTGCTVSTSGHYHGDDEIRLIGFNATCVSLGSQDFRVTLCIDRIVRLVYDSGDMAYSPVGEDHVSRYKYINICIRMYILEGT